LLCQHLIMSVAIDQLIKIRLICEAAWLVDPEKTGLDLKQIETIYTVASSLLNTFQSDDFTAIAWSFTLTFENYKRFIEPWRRNTPLSFRSSCTAESDKKRKRLSEAKSDAEEFWLFTQQFDLHPSSLQILKSEFLRWSIPQVMEIFEKLSRLVQPDLYKEMLQVMKGEITKR